jgi:hypothetical protein
MKGVRFLLFSLLLICGAGMSTSALAQWRHGWWGPRVGIGFNFGFPIYAPYYPAPYYYPPAPYYPPAVAAPAPQQYIEAVPQQVPAQPQGSWYYCAESKSYYPYVRACPGGWQQVAPTPG